jgi:hypothetical protein
MLDNAERAALESALMALRGSLESSVEALKRDPLLTQIKDTHQGLNTLEEVLQVPKTSLARLLFGPKQEE